MTASGNAIAQAKGRLTLFESEVGKEPWKKAHDEAMACLSFEGTLKFGVALYDFLIGLDEAYRHMVLKGHAKHDPKVIGGLFEWWLKLSADVEKGLAKFEKKGYAVELAGEFRKRHAEARWMLQDAAEAVSHPKMVGLRDEAVEAFGLAQA